MTKHPVYFGDTIQGELLEFEFEYKEDEKFFADLLSDGDIERLKIYKHLFDFRLPAMKRKEFNMLRNSIFSELMSQYGGSCGLRFYNICEGDQKLSVDHLIPLSSNILNKSLRHFCAKPG